MSKSNIQWTDETWNPTTGCTRVSAGCDHCYAFQLHDQRHVAWKLACGVCDLAQGFFAWQEGEAVL